MENQQRAGAFLCVPYGDGLPCQHISKDEKMKLALVPAAAAVVALAMTPALARSEQLQPLQGASYWQQPYRPAPAPRWNGSDPSFGNRTGIGNARTNNRCVEDLGYGRYEYCD
jgi:hypothetical protein